jgi:hypothetical protein
MKLQATLLGVITSGEPFGKQCCLQDGLAVLCVHHDRQLPRSIFTVRYIMAFLHTEMWARSSSGSLPSEAWCVVSRTEYHLRFDTHFQCLSYHWFYICGLFNHAIIGSDEARSL